MSLGATEGDNQKSRHHKHYHGAAASAMRRLTGRRSIDLVRLTSQAFGGVWSPLNTNDDFVGTRGRALCEEISERPGLYLLDQASLERSLVRSQRARTCIPRQRRDERFVSNQLIG